MISPYDKVIVMFLGGTLLTLITITVIMYFCLKRKLKELGIKKQIPRIPNRHEILDKEFDISKEMENIRETIFALLFFLLIWFVTNYSVIEACL